MTYQSEFNALQTQVQAVQQELAQMTQKNTDLQRTLETERIAWATDRKTLEDTIIDMSTSERNSENDRVSRESEVREQEQRARVCSPLAMHRIILTYKFRRPKNATLAKSLHTPRH